MEGTIFVGGIVFRCG